MLQGAELLAKGDLKAFGALMFDSHESSRNWFENSCEELDAIVDTAKTIPEVYGARLSGGGFGGSCCLLVDPTAPSASSSSPPRAPTSSRANLDTARPIGRRATTPLLTTPPSPAGIPGGAFLLPTGLPSGDPIRVDPGPL